MRLSLPLAPHQRPLAYPTPTGRAQKATRPVQIIDGHRCYWCAMCQTWQRVEQFQRLSNPLSRCGKRSECRGCSSSRRQRQREAYASAGLESA